MNDRVGPPPDTGTTEPGRAKRAKFFIGATVVVAAGIVVLISQNNGDDRVATTTPASTTTIAAATSTSIGAADTTTSSNASNSTYDSAVWPWSDTSQRFSDPVEAARSFAVDYVGFIDPVMGEFQQGDSRSGEVEVKPSATGPVSTVFVRQLGDDETWWVLGSATANIEVDEPTALAAITSPVTLTGRANAFEGTVNVTVRVDGRPTPLVEGFVTGMMGEMGPFASILEFPSAGGTSGSVVFRTLSAEDGSVWEAGVVRIGFVAGA